MHFQQTKIKKEDSDHNFCTQAPDVLKTERRVNYTFDLYKVSKLVKILPPPLKKGKFKHAKTENYTCLNSHYAPHMYLYSFYSYIFWVKKTYF